jgi:cytidyltransferase-like protein
MIGVAVTGSFDDMRSRHVRFLEEASKIGQVRVFLWSDEAAGRLDRRAPKFSQDERRYLLQSLRYVHEVVLTDGPASPDTIPCAPGAHPAAWIVMEQDDHPEKRKHCISRNIRYIVVKNADLAGFPPAPSSILPATPGRKKIIVTGCYDWFHSGHVRFFEEVAALGDLYVLVGHDANIRLLKGDGHPMFPQADRRYMAGAIRYVRQALVTSGNGWLDAEPEIAVIKPDMYAVNEDGDRPEKKEFCFKTGIEYVVLKREPRPGLPRRKSTDLRGF